MLKKLKHYAVSVIVAAMAAIGVALWVIYQRRDTDDE